MQGLSPRVRGNRYSCHHLPGGGGSIPACAGEPSCGGSHPSYCPVYPRVCGGTQRRPSEIVCDRGLSPRVRGNPAPPGYVGPEGRSIPACAGEPSIAAFSLSSSAVYPRVCGGTSLSRPDFPPGKGLSPRVRGNPPPGTGLRPPRRSIPACAGEPGQGVCSRTNTMVYPRVCGGTQLRGVYQQYQLGLSPRVRGNQLHRQFGNVGSGSIPACAGEPRHDR